MAERDIEKNARKRLVQATSEEHVQGFEAQMNEQGISRENRAQWYDSECSEVMQLRAHERQHGDTGGSVAHHLTEREHRHDQTHQMEMEL